MYTNFIGIDIGKFEIVTGLHGSKSVHVYKNTKEGFDAFISDYKDHLTNSSLVILETTGGFEKLFLGLLLKNGICVHRANTRQTKAFTKSLGVKGKTDAIDALTLARYGYERHDRLALYAPMKKPLEALQALTQRRLDLNQLLVQEKNRLQAPETLDWVKESCKTMILHISEQIREVTQEMERQLALCPDLIEKRKILQTIPGIGEITSLQLVTLLPELGLLDRRQIASLVGLAPHPYESGTKTGYRRTFGGRRDVRSILFMAGMAASISKSSLGQKYQSFLERGKKKMVAMVAIMRNIVVIANAKIKEYLSQSPTTIKKTA
jgi:transposase